MADIRQRLEIAKIIKIISFSYGGFVAHWRNFLPLILRMLPILVILSFFINTLNIEKMVQIEDVREMMEIKSVILLPIFLATIWLHCPLYVSVFRFILKQEAVNPNFYHRIFNYLELGFFIRLIQTKLLIGVISGVISTIFLILMNVVTMLIYFISPEIAKFVAPFLGVTSFVICFCLLLFLWARFCLVLPAFALLEPILAFKKSFDLVKGHTWVFASSLVLVTMPLAIVSGLHEFIINVLGLEQNIFLHIIFSVIFNFAEIYLVIPPIAVMAYMYRQVVQKKP